MNDISAFIRESNRIEGILRDPTEQEISTFETFLKLDRPEIHHLEEFVSIYQPGAILRRTPDLNVRVGNHIAPRGGPQIEEHLSEILTEATYGVLSPFEIHIRYEALHPFTDGNGRSGRALWAWGMKRFERGFLLGFPLGFLHHFYYQTLQHSR